MAEIVRDDDVRSGEPRIASSRITVLDVKQRVIDEGERPHVVAGEYDLRVADLFRALAYYYDHRDQFQPWQENAAATRADGERRTRSVLDDAPGTEQRTD